MGAKHRVVCLYVFRNWGWSVARSEKNELSSDFVEVRSLAEACYRFTSQIAIRTPQLNEQGFAIFLETSASENLCAEQLLKMKLASLAKRFRWLSRITFGDSAGEAFALARNPGFGYAQELPLESLIDFAAPFQLDDEQKRNLEATLHTLKIFGLKTVWDFTVLPASALAYQFGDEAHELASQIELAKQSAWPVFQPSLQISERQKIKNSETMDALGAQLKLLLNRTLARTHGRSERISQIQLVLETPGGFEAKRIYQIKLPTQQSTDSNLYSSIKEKLMESLRSQPLLSSVAEMELSVVETVASRGAKKDFYSRRQNETRVWHSVISQLSLKSSSTQVPLPLHPNHRPIKFA